MLKSYLIIPILIFFSSSSYISNGNLNETNKLEVKELNIPLATVLGPSQVIAGQQNQWSAVLSEAEAESFVWYQREQGQTYWTVVGTGRHYVKTFQIYPPEYNIFYEIKVDITTDEDEVYTSYVHTVEAYYDPGWEDCEYVGGPDCDSQF